MNSHDSQSSPHAPNVLVAPSVTELTAEQLQFQIAATVDFRTTEELSAGQEFVGQVNGLSVLQLGEHSFGQPSRVTGLKAFAAPAGSETEQRKPSDNDNHQPDRPGKD